MPQNSLASLAEMRPFTGVYTVHDAARYVRATTPPPGVSLSGWEGSRSCFTVLTPRHIAAWLRTTGSDTAPVDDGPQRRSVSFEELIRLRLIAILRSRGVPMDAVRRAERFASRTTCSAQPFATEALWTFSSDIFPRLAELLVAASGEGQLTMEFLAEYLQPIHHGLQFGPDGQARSWRPMPSVLLKPGIAFGAPCIQGTRVQTEVLWALHQAGAAAAALAEMYDISASTIAAALAWEETLAQAA